MFQNLKVDIVYYKTNTDFEMEFNLCGCCRMRLLTDKAPDQKLMLHSLARAVSRSKIIIVVGSLFGEDSIVKLVSKAIGRPTSIADNAAFGIVSDDEIEIIDSATPLVTSEGYFGGCIIESGPQTMILLSENKNVRKPVMQNLIHPYIVELCADELKEKAATALESTETEEENSEPKVEETEVPEAVEETVEETPTKEPEPEIKKDAPKETDDQEIEVSGTMTFETEEKVITAVPEHKIKASSDKESPKSSEIPEIDFNDFDYDLNLNESNAPEKKKRRKPISLNLPILILSILLLITMAVVVYCLFYVPAKSGVSPSAYIREIFNTLFS